MFRKLLIAPLALGIVVIAGAAALAGGWATTEFDEPLPEFVAGEEYEVGFTVRQHGVTPRWTEGAGLSFTPPDGGDSIVFFGEPSGEVGRFQATVVLPGGGTWDLEVDQGILPGTNLHFAPHLVGPVEVACPGKNLADAKPAPLPATPAPPRAEASRAIPSTLAGPGLAVPALAAAALGGILVLSLARRRRTISPQTVYKKAQSSSEGAWTTEN